MAFFIYLVNIDNCSLITNTTLQFRQAFLFSCLKLRANVFVECSAFLFYFGEIVLWRNVYFVCRIVETCSCIYSVYVSLINEASSLLPFTCSLSFAYTSFHTQRLTVLWTVQPQSALFKLRLHVASSATVRWAHQSRKMNNIKCWTRTTESFAKLLWFCCARVLLSCLGV